MNQLENLRTHGWSPPPPNVLETVVVAGRGRRRRVVSGTGVLAAASVVLALHLVPGSDDAQTLLPAQQPTAAPLRGMPSPGSDVGGSDLQQHAGAGTAPRRVRSGVGAPAAADARRSASGTSGAPGAAPASPQPPALPGTPPRRTAPARSAYDVLTKRRATGPDPTPCDYEGPRATICATDAGSDADVSPAADGRRSLGFHVCNETGRPRTLAFASEAEVVLAVRDVNEQVVWQWRPARPYRAEPHEDVVAGGECLFWATTWREVADDGTALPAGAYSLSVTFLAEGSGRGRHVRTFTVAR